MSNISIITVFSVLLLTIICSAQSQVLRRPDDDNQQQVIKKVERINLSDFGIRKTDRVQSSRSVQREDDQRIKEVAPVGRDFSSSPRRIGLPSERGSSGRGYSSGRELSSNRELSSGRELSGTEFSSGREFSSSRGSSSGRDFDSSSRRVDIPSRRGSSDRSYDFSSRDFDLLSRGSSSGRTRDCSNCVEPKYLQHYYSRGCQPNIDSVCNCITSFDCPSYPRYNNASECRYDGRSYSIGSRIPVKNPCRICDCRDFGRRNNERNAVIDCGIGIECPEEAFGVKPQPNCYFSYEHGKCCGRHECPNKLNSKRAPKVCKYKGKEYKLGQKIYPDEDPCLTCYCTEDWNDDNPLSSLACHKFKCEFELNPNFNSGCLPIYHEGTCCPIEYKCPKAYALPSETPSNTQCVFEGRKYPIGSKLNVDNVCVDCTCKIPPDFTCIHKSCPSPDSNCFVAKWDNSVCCQKYTCSRPQELRDESQFRDSFYSPKNN